MSVQASRGRELSLVVCFSWFTLVGVAPVTTGARPVHLPLLTCSDHGRLRVGTQHALVVEFTLVVHVVLKLPQRLRRLQQLPVFVVWEVVLNEQGGVGEEVEFVVAGVEEGVVRSPV